MKATFHAEVQTELKIPDTMAGVADAWWAFRQQRLELQKGIDLIKGHEEQLKAHVEKEMPKDETGAAGLYGRIEVSKDPTVKVKDWPTFWKWIARNKAFDFVQKRVTESAVVEYLKVNPKKKIAGVSIGEERSVSLLKVEQKAA